MTKRKWLKVAGVVFTSTIVVLLALFIMLGTPRMAEKQHEGEWRMYSTGGYLVVMAWSDHYSRGAMVYRGTDSGWVEGAGGCRVRHYDTTWQIRADWYK